MDEMLLFSGIYLVGVVISAFSQILLKKSANVEKNQSIIKQYLNKRVIIAYLLFFGATLLTIYAYKVIPITLGSILGTIEYGLVAFLSYYFFKEKLARNQIIGLLLIILGIFVYSINF